MDPRTEYTRRLEAKKAAAAEPGRLHIRAGNVRLLIALAAFVALLDLVDRVRS